VAPDPPADGELWLDVGDRLAPQVMDHHDGTADAECATELVFRRYRDLVLEPLADRPEITVVLHDRPDLDSVAAAWLARMALDQGSLPGAAETIVMAVGEHDQGVERIGDLHHSWPTVFRLVLDFESNRDNEDLIKVGSTCLDQTLEVLEDGGSLADAAERIMTLTVRIELAQAERDYQEDLARGRRFQIRLPVDAVENHTEGNCRARWPIADGLYLEEPASSLFKEFARNDKANSPLGRGFSLLVVSRPVTLKEDRLLWRHIISTNPLSGLHLQGIGNILEHQEQEKENTGGAPLLVGRERVEPGSGRHGANVVSPWYDGRGHRFTIVDSPLVEVGGHQVCASCLSPSEVLETLWSFGDPSASIRILEAEVTLFLPVHLDDDWHKHWPEPIELSAVCPELCDEVRESDSLIAIYRRQGEWETGIDGLQVVEQELWTLPNRLGLWVGTCRVGEAIPDAREFSLKMAKLVRDSQDPLLPLGLTRSATGRSFHIAYFRTRSSDLSMNPETGPAAQALHLLASAKPSYFGSWVAETELAAAKMIATTDRKYLTNITENGAVAASVCETTFAIENDFRRPDRLRVLAALSLSQRIMLQSLSSQFTRHRELSHSAKGARLILSDQWQLLRLEQELSVGRITDLHFGQAVYEALVDVLDLRSLLTETRRKIETMASLLRDTKAAFMQQVGFWVSVLFAPLAITAGFFSGTHMERKFSDVHYTLFPTQWDLVREYSGWIQFFLIFSLISCAVGLLWFVVRLLFRRQDISRRFGRPRPDSKQRAADH